MGIRVTARKWPSTVEPAISISTMDAVRSDSVRDFTNPPRPMPRCATASRITAKVPTLPASVGVKKPFISPPMITTNTSSTHTTSGSEARRSFHVDLAPFGPREGSIRHQITMVRAKSAAMMIPGMMPPRKSRPMDCSVMMPKTIRVTLGGMRMPSVPTLATTPVERRLS
jgi:hypothetical protein